MHAKCIPQPDSVLRGHTNGVSCVNFSCSGSSIVSGDSSGKVVLWDIETRRPLLQTSLHSSSSILQADFLNNDTLCTQGRDGEIAIWNIKEYPWKNELVTPFTSYNFCRFELFPKLCPELRQLFLAIPTKDNEVLIRDLRTNSIGQVIPTAHQEKTGQLMCISLYAPSSASNLSDGMVVLGFESGHIAVWDLTQTKTPLRFIKLHQEAVLCTSFSPDGQYLGSGGCDNKFQLLNSPAMELCRSYECFRGVSCSSFRNDCRLVAVGSWDHRIRVYDIVKPKQLAVLKVHEKSINALQYSPSNNFMVAGSEDGLVSLWNLYPFVSKEAIRSKD